MEQKLKGRRIAAFAADSFGKAELTVRMDALRLPGVAVNVISLRPGRIRGVNLHEPASRGDAPVNSLGCERGVA